MLISVKMRDLIAFYFVKIISEIFFVKCVQFTGRSDEVGFLQIK